jgi:hypothetical protein
MGILRQNNIFAQSFSNKRSIPVVPTNLYRLKPIPEKAKERNCWEVTHQLIKENSYLRHFVSSSLVDSSSGLILCCNLLIMSANNISNKC